MKMHRVFLLVSIIILLAAGTNYAQDYPTKPVHMIVPFAPGGASDIIARAIQPVLTRVMGQQVIVDNRSGASGNVGVEVAARSAPDGYTILLGEGGAMTVNPSLITTFPIKPLRDFIAITQLVEIPGCLVAHPSLPVATIKELIEFGKANPGKINYGSAGIGSPFALATEYFVRKAGIKTVHIPYGGGAGPAVIGIISGEVDIFVVNVAAIMPHIKSGKVKPLGIVGQKRVADLPDTPTMIELGYPDMFPAWQGVYVPTGTPQPIVGKLLDVFRKTMTDPETVTRLTAMGAQITLSKSPEDFVMFNKYKTEFYEKLIKDTGMATK